MRYRLSPINIFVGLSVLGLLVSPLFEDSGTGDLLSLVYLMPLFIFGLLIDAILQIFLTNYRKIIIIELVIVIMTLMLISTLLK